MAQYSYDGDIPTVGTVTVPEPLSVDDNGASLTVDGTVAVSGTVTTAESRLPSALGQATMANSVAVALASNQTAIPVTDNSGSLTVDSAQLPSALGQTTMAASLPVAIASNQTAVPVSGTLTAVTTVGTITNVVHVDDNSGSITVDGTVAVSALSGTSAVSMASPPTPPSSLFNNKTTVTTAGSRVVLGTSQALKVGVWIRAATGNTGLIYVGDSTVSSSNGYELAPGETIFIAIADRNTVNLDASVNSQSVTYVAS